MIFVRVNGPPPLQTFPGKFAAERDSLKAQLLDLPEQEDEEDEEDE